MGRGKDERKARVEDKNPYSLRLEESMLKPNLIGPPLLKVLYYPVEFSVMMELFHNALINIVSLWLV